MDEYRVNDPDGCSVVLMAIIVAMVVGSLFLLMLKLVLMHW